MVSSKLRITDIHCLKDYRLTLEIYHCEFLMGEMIIRMYFYCRFANYFKEKTEEIRRIQESAGLEVEGSI